MRPSLPSTLVFAAFSMTALAVAAAIDVANAVLHGAAAVGQRVFGGGPVRIDARRRSSVARLRE